MRSECATRFLYATPSPYYSVTSCVCVLGETCKILHVLPYCTHGFCVVMQCSVLCCILRDHSLHATATKHCCDLDVFGRQCFIVQL